MALPSVPPGFQYTTLTLPGGGWSTESIPYNQSPSVVTGDTLMTPLLTSGGFPVVATVDGIVSVDTNGSSARQLLVGVDIYRVAADAFMGAATFAINNQAPSAVNLSTPVILLYNHAMTAINLALDFSDAEADTITYLVTSGSAPTGTSVNSSGSWTGTPTSISSGTFTLTGTDPYNASDTLVVLWNVINTVTVPDIDNPGTSEGAAVAALNNVFLNSSISRQNNALIPQGEIISQSPAPGATATPGDTVSLVVSLGAVVLASEEAQSQHFRFGLRLPWFTRARASGTGSSHTADNTLITADTTIKTADAA